MTSWWCCSCTNAVESPWQIFNIWQDTAEQTYLTPFHPKLFHQLLSKATERKYCNSSNICKIILERSSSVLAYVMFHLCLCNTLRHQKLAFRDHLAFLTGIPQEAGFLPSVFWSPLFIQGVTRTHVLTMLPQGLPHLQLWAATEPGC